MTMKGICSNFIFLSIVAFLTFACNSSNKAEPPKLLEIDTEITIDDIRQAYENNEYTISDLTQYYLDRIEELSYSGPTLNAVLTINPDALEIAGQLDTEMQEGKIRGPLHGIPILLKDNVDTADKMPCTAGAIPMKDSYPLTDSPIAAQLRKAGAVILGKANLSEWANFHSTTSSSGWSGLGGQTKNPYQLSRNPCGSSSGSGVAVSANLSVLAIGTETSGSIICPSNNNGIVGIKPTVGLVSRRGIIPVSASHDTGGPMARTVKDAALCLGALTDIDSLDSRTIDPNREAYTDYSVFLKVDGLQGKRIGFWKTPLAGHSDLTEVMHEAVAYFKSQGAEIIELEEVVDPSAREHSVEVMNYEFKKGLNDYFVGLGPDAEVTSLEDLIEKTFADSVEMKYHDHQLFKIAQSKGSLDSEEYKKALEAMWSMSRENGIDKVMEEHELDAIIANSLGPAWQTDLVNGDHSDYVSTNFAAAIAGYPNITVPMGEINGLPVGLSIFGKAWSEPVLLEIAYSYEQGTKKRITPTFLE